MSLPLSPAESVAVARLHALLELLPAALDKRLGVGGVTAFEHTLLDALSHRGQEPMRLSELARQTNATLPRTSRVATGLEKRGLITRSTCPEDGRATNAALTSLGTDTHARSRVLYANAVRELVFAGLEQLPGGGIAQLTALSSAVLANLDPEHPAGPTESSNAR